MVVPFENCDATARDDPAELELLIVLVLEVVLEDVLMLELELEAVLVPEPEEAELELEVATMVEVALPVLWVLPVDVEPVLDPTLLVLSELVVGVVDFPVLLAEVCARNLPAPKSTNEDKPKTKITAIATTTVDIPRVLLFLSII